MNLEVLVSFKKKLEELYHINEKNFSDGFRSNNEIFDETMRFLSNLYRNDEIVKSYIMNNDIVSLHNYLALYGYSLFSKYGDYGNKIRELCKKTDFTLIKVYFDRTFESIMHPENKEMELLDKEFSYKANMIFDFYQDIINYNFHSLFEYVKKCDLVNNLCYLTELYNKSIKEKTKYGR